jgi:UPF0716 family protein affecting phage T7 exclusion
MQIKLFEWLHKRFGSIRPGEGKRWMKKRLPIYLAAALILIFGGIQTAMITFALIMSFTAGWIAKGLIQAIKDYRLTQRLNRIHFTATEFDTMRRERDMAIEALQAIQQAQKERRSSGPKAAPMPPSAPAAPRRLTPDEIQEMILQAGGSAE